MVEHVEKKRFQTTYLYNNWCAKVDFFHDVILDKLSRKMKEIGCVKV